MILWLILLALLLRILAIKLSWATILLSGGALLIGVGFAYLNSKFSGATPIFKYVPLALLLIPMVLPVVVGVLGGENILVEAMIFSGFVHVGVALVPQFLTARKGNP